MKNEYDALNRATVRPEEYAPVPLGEAQQNCAPGCTVYGAYYVPAVRGEYIAGAPAA